MPYLCNAMAIQDTYKYSSIDVARYIVAYANENKFGINLTKMLKLTYFLYGAYLAYTGERLTDEHPVAWTYGPVFERARRYFMYRDLLDISMDDVNKNLLADEDVKAMIEFTFKVCGKYSASALVSWTHKPSSPWTITINECKGHEGGVIRDEVVYDYFHGVMYEGRKG